MECSSSSREMVRSMVSAEMVTTAVPLVGTIELMVMIFALFYAKIVKILESRPGSSWSRIWKVMIRPVIMFWNGSTESRYL